LLLYVAPIGVVGVSPTTGYLGGVVPPATPRRNLFAAPPQQQPPSPRLQQDTTPLAPPSPTRPSRLEVAMALANAAQLLQQMAVLIALHRLR